MAFRSLSLALAAVALACNASVAPAQAYPVKPIRLVVGFTPGGGVDINARLFGPKLAEYLGQQIIVENRPGAGTNIANEFVAKSPPDGYTLLINTAALAINLSLYRKVPYEARDFTPISILSMSPNILVVHSSVPVKSAKELIALAKSRPGQLNYSSAGSGTTQHLSGELFNLKTGIKMVHVPYRGSAPSLTALISGEVGLSFANIPAISAHVKSGRLRPLSEAIVRASRASDVQQRLQDLGAEPVGNTPEVFGKLFREEVARWAEVVKVSGARAD
jgi:tripartite-type tricarboxylate transporter receptor subunit TctC